MIIFLLREHLIFMASTKDIAAFFSKNTMEASLLTSAFLAIHIVAYLDRESDKICDKASDYISLSFMSKIISILHSLATTIKVYENFERSGGVGHNSRYKTFAVLSVAGSFGLIAGQWLTSHSIGNLGCALGNGVFNFFGRLSSAAYRKKVASFDLDFNSISEDLLIESHPESQTATQQKGIK
jgi:hypothetical protein